MQLRYWIIPMVLVLLSATATFTWHFKSPITAAIINHALTTKNTEVSCLSWDVKSQQLIIKKLCITTPYADIELSNTTLSFAQPLFEIIQHYQSISNTPSLWPDINSQSLHIRLKHSLSTLTSSPQDTTSNSGEADELQALLIEWQKLPQLKIDAAHVTLLDYPNLPVTFSLEASSNTFAFTLHEHEQVPELYIEAQNINNAAMLATKLPVDTVKKVLTFTKPMIPTWPSNLDLLLESIKQGQLKLSLTATTELIKANVDIQQLHTEIPASIANDVRLNHQLSPHIHSLMSDWFALDPQGNLLLKLNTNLQLAHQRQKNKTDLIVNEDSTLVVSPSSSTLRALLQTQLNKLPSNLQSAIPIEPLINQELLLGFPKQITLESGKLSKALENITLSTRPQTPKEQPLFTANITADLHNTPTVRATLSMNMTVNATQTDQLEWSDSDIQCHMSMKWQPSQLTTMPVCNLNSASIKVRQNGKSVANLEDTSIHIDTKTPVLIKDAAMQSNVNVQLYIRSLVNSPAFPKKIQSVLTSHIELGKPEKTFSFSARNKLPINSKHSLTLDTLPEIKLTTMGTPTQQQFTVDPWQADIYQLTPYVKRFLPNTLIFRGGNITISADGSWAHNRLSTNASINSSGVTGEFDGILFADASHTLSAHINDKQMNTTPLSFKVGLVDSGILTSNIHGKVGMETDLVNEIFSLTLQDMKGEVLGGRFSLSPGKVYPELATEWNIQLDELSLAELVPPSDEFQVTVKGRVSGDIPVELLESGPIVKQGRLRNISDGEIRIQQNATIQAIAGGNEQVSRGMDYLSNLQFTELRCEVSMTEDATVLLKNHVVGRNPDLDQAIELNYNHEQNFFMWLKLLREGERIMDSFTNKN